MAQTDGLVTSDPDLPEVWDALGPSSRERLLQERETSDRCYFCGQTGHRAYYCGSMLALACKWGQLTGQKKIGGAERRQSLWCSSCAYNKTVAFMAKNEAIRHATGWFNHTRGTCHQRSYCKLAEDEQLCRMSQVQLRDHLLELGLLKECKVEMVV